MKIYLNKITALALGAVCIFSAGCGNSKVKKASLPTDNEIKSAGAEGIAQTDEMGDYVLSDYEVESGTIVYTFSEKQDDKNTLSVTGKKMTYEDYTASLPVGDLKEMTINNIDCRFIDRTVHYVPDDYVPDERVSNNVAKGTTEIKYGNPYDLDELLPIQRVYWYDSEKSIGYSLEAMGKYYTMEDMSIYVQNYVENAK